MKEKRNSQMHELAQLNVARMKGENINDPIMEEFVNHIDQMNELAEQSEGFVWRLKDESNNACNFNPLEDEQIIVNLSVWKNVESLQQFTYQTFHSQFVKRRKEWFHNYGKVHYVLWWIEAGQLPTLEESVERLHYLEQKGTSAKAFQFKDQFVPKVYSLN